MNILCIGDIVGQAGVQTVMSDLSYLKKEHDIGFCIANGENATTGNGITKERADMLLDAGVDVITMGNHLFRKREVFELFKMGYPILRPANLPPQVPGKGAMVIKAQGAKVGVISLIGRVNMHPADCPFRAADKEIEAMDEAEYIFVDFHADATSEKIALGWYLDGRVTCTFGTHTHVQSADERILPGGSAYITDLGMTGPVNSVLGVVKEASIKRFLTGIPEKFDIAEGNTMLCGVVVAAEHRKKAKKISRLRIG